MIWGFAGPCHVPDCVQYVAVGSSEMTNTSLTPSVARCFSDIFLGVWGCMLVDRCFLFLTNETTSCCCLEPGVSLGVAVEIFL